MFNSNEREKVRTKQSVPIGSLLYQREEKRVKMNVPVYPNFDVLKIKIVEKNGGEERVPVPRSHEINVLPSDLNREELFEIG